MIGRLVEQQQVGLRHQRLAEQARAAASRPTARPSAGRPAGARRETTSSTFCSSRQPSRSSSWCCSIAEPLSAPRRRARRRRSRHDDTRRPDRRARRDRSPPRRTRIDARIAGSLAPDAHVLLEPRDAQPGRRQIVPPSGATPPADDLQQARLARIRCGRSARCARPARSGDRRPRTAADVQGERDVIEGEERH